MPLPFLYFVNLEKKKVIPCCTMLMSMSIDDDDDDMKLYRRCLNIKLTPT